MTQVTTETSAPKQSRVGKQPVPVPSGVTATLSDGKISIKGPNGSFDRAVPKTVSVAQEDGRLLVKIEPSAGAAGCRDQGLVRALLKNMVEGVDKGFKASLDLYGVGYRAELSGTVLTLTLGLSHQVKLDVPKEVKVKIETIDEAGQKRPRVHLSSCDKEILGRVAARIKSFRPPEPYNGKGVRFTGERIREKAGKSGAKGKA